MVLESIVNYLSAEKRPDEMLLYGFIITTLSIFLALWVFPSYASFVTVTFIIMAVSPVMAQIMQFEKEKQENAGIWWMQVIAHKKAVIFFIFLFLGFTLAYVFWFLMLPTGITNSLFSLQANTIAEVNNPTGSAIAIQDTFANIFVNNIRILALSILFSLIFGSGVIFILAWNASVLGVAMATAIKIAVAASGNGSAAYFGAFSFAIVRYLLHGIPEITAFFLGGLAGGIISFTILDYKLGLKKFLSKMSNSLKDASMLTVSAILLLVLATLIEVFVTPMFIL